MNKYPNASRQLKSGSGIYIKPENKGKFTASANAAGMGVQEFASHVLANKDNYSSTQVKRANFARNAAGWKHANGGHILAAGGWPPGLKLKNSTLSFMPFYTNAMTGLMAPSAEIGLDTKIGKQKGGMGWSVSPHIGLGYNSPNKFPLSGGIDARYKGLRSPSGKGYATVDLGAGYTPDQGFGFGTQAGYNFRLLGQSNKRLGEIPAGTASLDLMPYAGWQVNQRPKQAIAITDSEGNPVSKNVAFQSSPIYGINAEGQWRPKLFKHAVHKAPVTFFAKGNLNVNPVRGQLEQQAAYEVTSSGAVNQATGAPETGYGYETNSGVKFKPQFSGIIGARMPISRLKEYMPKRRIEAVEGGEYYEETPTPGNYTFAFRTPEIDAKGNSIRGEYTESAKDFKKRASQWGSNTINPNFMTDWETRKDLQNAAVDDEGRDLWAPNQIDFNEQIIQNDDYKYGGAMKFKYGGFNNLGFNALPKDVQAKIKARTFANGGTMPQLTEFNEGGTHEENRLGGIPQGSAPDGRLNLVEEGETKLNASNYIFSDTLKLDEGIASAFNLPKKDVGKTFAEISKRLNRPNSRRDNDTIEQNAKQRDLENLMQAQEAFKAVDLQKDMEMMQRKHPEMMEALQGAMSQEGQGQPAPEEMQQGQPQMSPEEQQMMMQQQQQEMMMAQQGGMPEEQMGQIPMSYGGSIFARGGKMCMTGGRMYPNGGALDMPYTVSGNMPAYDNRAFMSPAEMQNYPMFGSEKEALLWMQNPENEASVAQWEFPEKGIGGQVRSNFYMNPNQPATGIYPGASSNKQLRTDLGVYDTPQFSFMQNPNTMASGYRSGGHMYRMGGNDALRAIGAGAYGAGEGLLDTLTFGLTDSLTDKGFEKLSGIGNRDAEELEREKMIRGFGNTAGAIGGAIVSGGATTGSAISQGSKGLGAGLTSIKGTNENFDNVINSLAKAGSFAGSLVGGGNPAGGLSGAAGAAEGAVGALQGAEGVANLAPGTTQIPQFAQKLMNAGQNPFLKQVVGMGSGMIPQKNGGHLYPTIYPRYKNNAGPMGQRMDVLFKYGGSFEAPRQQMYMPLDNVARMGGVLYNEGGDLENPGGPFNIDPLAVQKNVQPLISPNAYLINPNAAVAMGYDPKVVAEWTDPNTGEYEVPPAYRLEGDLSNFVSGLAGNPNILEGAATSAANAFRAPIERMPYLKPGQISPKIAGELAGLSDVENIDPSIVSNTLSTQNNLLRENNTGTNNEPSTDNETKVNFTIIDAYTNIPKVVSYTKEEALESPELLAIMDADEIADYFEEAENKGTSSENNEGSGSDSNIGQEETDLEREIRLAEEAIKNAKTEEEKKKTQEYLSELKRAKMDLENRNVDLGMKQTLPQFLGLTAPAAYNIGMGLFGKTAKYNLEDYLNKSKITPYEVNVDPQLNQTRLAYNAAQEAIRNAAPGSGAYLTNLANIASRRSASFKDILAGKENADKQLKTQADIYNANIKGQNAETALKVQDLNYKGEAAKQQMLAKGLEQLAQMSEGSQTMDAQEKYMRLLSPQYGKTFEYKSIFDQAMEALRNRKNNKDNTEV
jgi:hypothetical protein